MSSSSSDISSHVCLAVVIPQYVLTSFDVPSSFLLFSTPTWPSPSSTPPSPSQTKPFLPLHFSASASASISTATVSFCPFFSASILNVKFLVPQLFLLDFFVFLFIFFGFPTDICLPFQRGNLPLNLRRFSSVIEYLHAIGVDVFSFFFFNLRLSCVQIAAVEILSGLCFVPEEGHQHVLKAITEVSPFTFFSLNSWPLIGISFDWRTNAIPASGSGPSRDVCESWIAIEKFPNSFSSPTERETDRVRTAILGLFNALLKTGPAEVSDNDMSFIIVQKWNLPFSLLAYYEFIPFAMQLATSNRLIASWGGNSPVYLIPVHSFIRWLLADLCHIPFASSIRAAHAGSGCG